jgi:hypothetical protein
MKFQITFVEFWNRVGRDLGFKLYELTFEGAYYLENRQDILLKELGLEIMNGFLNIFYFKVVDQRRFFLAKLKYGI